VAALGLPILAAVLMAGGSVPAQAAHVHGGSMAAVAANIQRPLDLSRATNAPQIIADVTIANFAFTPNPLTINVGDSVRWTNTDAATHTATSDAGAPATFTTGNLTQGQSATILFTVAGTYNYHCAIHPSMVATLIVNGAPTATSTATPVPPTATRTATPVPPTATRTATQVPPTATSTATFGPPPTVTSTATPVPPTATVTVPVELTVTSTVTGTPPTATDTPVPPTATATAPPTDTATHTATVLATRTATATATTCPIYFTDVTDPSAYYYQGVYYLACRGVISGYSDGTFQPFNNTTRGQLAKIVVLAYQFPLIHPTTPTFTDVPSSNVFYSVIETAVVHNLVSGYSCGGINPQTGLAEPCDSAHRPYFRPSNFVTRGQLTKIVVLAAGWTTGSPTTPTFSDVPTDNVFYPFIEEAACRGVVGGYSNGTFRPNNYAFRGQIAKIVYIAVATNPTCHP
jgi:plastocyanin